MASRENSRFHPYKKHKPSNTTPREQPSSGLSINDLKRRIRGVKRLLGHADLSPEARIVQERALAGYEKDLKDETERRQRSEMIKRYHFVRFLDRKTATKELRRLTQQQKSLEEEENDTKTAALQAIKQKVHVAQINVNYTIYYPLSEKYISLYPQDKKKRTSTQDQNDSDSDDVELPPKSGPRKAATGSKDEKPPLWAVVEKCTANGSLDQLRNGKLNIGFDGKPKEGAPVSSSQKTRENEKAGSRSTKRPSDTKTAASKKSQQYEQEEDDSDGGFFET
ncbi:rRNA-processing protein efg1 [Talaromyces islandicus]|uniref:rRNA-processing protein EFG1 n=1 Tax=Talaromyces islandicus TaxID=28573 RepID=A0A0U1LT17_TALIS|nr:rRNA-processing protein efg1 [Talaromyces islandicus]